MASETLEKLMIVFNALMLLFLCTTYIIVCTFFCAIMILTHMLVSFNTRWRHKVTVFIKFLWLNLTVTLLGFYFVHPLNICYNKKIIKKKKCIVISNHLTNYDWLYVLVVLAKLDMYEDLVIILKESLSKIPVYGYGMKIFGYIFLKRDWNRDREILANGLAKTREKSKYFMLIFPEGTLIDPLTHEKSRMFCKKNNISLLDTPSFNPENVILPRKTGFNMIFDGMKDQLDGVIDITILVNPYQQYPCLEFTLYDVFIKRSKKLDFMFLVDYVDKDEIKDEQWLYEMYNKKEKMIDKYKKLDAKKDMSTFKNVVEKLVRKKMETYNFDVAYVWSNWSKLHLTLAFLGYALVFYWLLKK